MTTTRRNNNSSSSSSSPSFWKRKQNFTTAKKKKKKQNQPCRKFGGGGSTPVFFGMMKLFGLLVLLAVLVVNVKFFLSRHTSSSFGRTRGRHHTTTNTKQQQQQQYQSFQPQQQQQLLLGPYYYDDQQEGIDSSITTTTTTTSSSSSSTAWPYLSHDIWYDVFVSGRQRRLGGRTTTEHTTSVGMKNNNDDDDNLNNIVVARGPLPPVNWKLYLDSLTVPVVIILNDNDDLGYPYNDLAVVEKLPQKFRPTIILTTTSSSDDQHHWLHPDLLRHPMLYRLYVTNPVTVAVGMNTHHNSRKQILYPLPIGLKWQTRSRELFGESKTKQNTLYKSIATRPKETLGLLQTKLRPVIEKLEEKLEHDSSASSSSTSSVKVTIWVRPGQNHALSSVMYNYTQNVALRTQRKDICPLLLDEKEKRQVDFDDDDDDGTTIEVVIDCGTATTTGGGSSTNSNSNSRKRLTPSQFYERLKSESLFVVSPPGHGLDTHATWEILLSGGIPIVPHSPLDGMFLELPVWLVNDYTEVVDSQNVKQKLLEIWDKLMIHSTKEEDGQGGYNFDKIYAQGWIDEIRSAAKDAAAASATASSVAS
eukprot:CAMPEP_0113497998 /NCGR_PEP_ID=MMETSP0014_2-20120614/30918_1 /TAXON_ID=2857 /ORGANISM="Nitzschia sp." /LENGTH=588 /DNA_ID=CAMNT_0000391953 /DNA_START=322 /DNA_END=2088 /DNA_ORIENTATION=- /assembly_acc=CAM_ASM_000159